MSVARILQDRFKDPAQFEKFLQAQRLADIQAGAETYGLLPLTLYIGGTENQDGCILTPHASTHRFEDLETGYFRQVQVDDNEMRTSRGLHIQGSNKADRILSVGNDDQFALNPVLLESLPHQSGIGRAILYQKNRKSLLVRIGLMRAPGRGL